MTCKDITMFKPSNEAILVLQQSGYSSNLLISNIEAYNKVLKNYPDMCKDTDKDFAIYLKCNNPVITKAIEKNLYSLKNWKLSDKELDDLNSLGYWREIALFFITDFIVYHTSMNSNLISPFNVYKKFLLSSVGLDRDRVLESWVPGHKLSYYYQCQHSLNQNDQHQLLRSFKANVLTREELEVGLPLSFDYYLIGNK